MRVDPKSLSPLTAPPARRETARGSFALDGREATKTGSAAASAPLSTVDALLALQGEEAPGERRRRALKRGHTLLDGLDRLKASLIGGAVPAADLTRLASELAVAREAAGDAGLDTTLEHIELRVRVELAKLGK